jgi:hypothetical protein
MFTTNPFAALPASISAYADVYVIVMFLFVIGGTVLDMLHKKSAQYFFENAKKAEKSAKRTVSGGEKASMAIQTVTSEGLTSAEFSNPKRRLSHLLTMYGFIIFVATTAIMIFSGSVSTLVPVLWHIGALMLCVGGYWFWFSIRVDVNAEGKKWYQLCRADLFIVSLLMTCTFALVWSFLQSSSVAGWDMLAFAFFILSSTVLFVGVYFSKFAHMFFKPAAAYQKRVTVADGSRENLPGDFDLTDPEVQKMFPDIPQYMGKNPENMGHGIRREGSSHY